MSDRVSSAFWDHAYGRMISDTRHHLRAEEQTCDAESEQFSQPDFKIHRRVEVGNGFGLGDGGDVPFQVQTR